LLGLEPGACRLVGGVRVCRPPVGEPIVFIGTSSEAAMEGLTPSSIKTMLHVPPLQAPRLAPLARVVPLAVSGVPVYSPSPGRLYTVLAPALEEKGYTPPLAMVEASSIGAAPVTLVQRHVAEAYYHARRLGLLDEIGALGEEVAEYAAVLSALTGKPVDQVLPAARYLAAHADYMIHGARLLGGVVGVYVSAPRMTAGNRVDVERVARACEELRRTGGRYGVAVKACRAWPPFSVEEA